MPSATRSRSSPLPRKASLPVMLKGPTGCGKTRFVEHMAWKLGGRWSPSPAMTT
jgi:tRNA A37 threonylcarbamoyladenosine biosynthesis protein TsaE